MIYANFQGADPNQENTEAGTAITFDTDYFGGPRGLSTIPGPFANAMAAEKALV